MGFLDGIISGVGNYLGAKENAAAQRDINNQNIIAQQQINAANREDALKAQQIASDQWKANYDFQERMANINLARQDEYARSGIRMKVADAVAAGLSPLAALGAVGAGSGPISVGSIGSAVVSPPHATAPHSSISGDVSGLAGMGQGLARAAAAVQTPDERAFTTAMAQMGLEKAGLENDYLRASIARMMSSSPAGPGGSMPSIIPGQGNDPSMSPALKADPHKVQPVAPGANAGMEPGINPEVQWIRGPKGDMWMIPSTKSKESVEDMGPYPWLFGLRNAILPTFGMGNMVPPPIKPDEGMEWYPKGLGVWDQRPKVSNPDAWWRGRNWFPGAR